MIPAASARMSSFGTKKSQVQILSPRPQFILVRDSLGKIEYAPCPNRALIWSPALPWTPGSPCFDG